MEYSYVIVEKPLEEYFSNSDNLAVLFEKFS